MSATEKQLSLTSRLLKHQWFISMSLQARLPRRWLQLRLWVCYVFQMCFCLSNKNISYLCNDTLLSDIEERSPECYTNLKCYYDEKCCSRSLSILILYLAKMHHANYWGLIKKKKKSNFLTTISRLNCLPVCSSRVALRELDWERKWRHLLTSLIFECVNPANLVCKT